MTSPGAAPSRSASRTRAAYIAGDALHRLRRPLTPTLIAVLIVFAGALSVFATTGLAVAVQQRTWERINSPEGRLITISDPQGDAGLAASSIPLLETLDGVDWVAAVSPARDVANVAIDGGATAPARQLYGAIPPPVRLEPASVPSPGEAWSGPGVARALGFSDGVGGLHGRGVDAALVGSFVATAPLERLNGDILIPAGTDSSDRLLTIWISVGDVTMLPEVTAAARASLIVKDPGGLRVETAAELASLSGHVADDLAQSARLTVGGLVLAVAVLIAAVQFGRVAGMSRDIGRSRALGASRSMIVLQILINAGLCGLIGAILGVSAGLAVTAGVAGSIPGAGFTLGVAVLMVLASVLGSVFPAIRASRLDPVSILRVP